MKRSTKREKNKARWAQMKKALYAEMDDKAAANDRDMTGHAVAVSPGGKVRRWVDEKGRLPGPVQEEFLRRTLEGDSLKAICSSEGMPDKATFYKFLHRSKAFQEAFYLARELASLEMEDEIKNILDELDGVANRDVAYVSDVRIKGLLALMKIKNPKRYGDKSNMFDGMEGEITVRFRQAGEKGREGEMVPASEKIIDVDPFKMVDG